MAENTMDYYKYDSPAENFEMENEFPQEQF
jgi:hypothetical protein